LIIAALTLGLTLAACTTDEGTSPAGGTSPGPGSPDPAKVEQGWWWAWAAAEAEGRDPVSDPTGEDCARNQPATVWYLAGTFGGTAERRCTVPAGRPLIAPAVNLFSEVGSDCADFMGSTSGEVRVDDAPVTLDRIASERIAFTGVPGNAIGTETDPIRAVACGLWARIPALSAGSHRVTIQGRADGIAVDVTYLLDVSAAA
jgi:hypothetical protein